MSNQFTKPAGKALDYQFNWSAWLVDGDTIASYTLTASGVTINSDSLIDGDTKIQYFVDGGVAGIDGSVECEIVTTNGLENCKTSYFTITACDDKTTITVADVATIYPNTANFDDGLVQMEIDFVSTVDACLIAHGYDDNTIRMLKMYAVAYGLFSLDWGGISSNTSPTKESVRFMSSQNQGGILSNKFGVKINNIDKSRCMVNLLESPENERFIVAVGASNYVSSS